MPPLQLVSTTKAQSYYYTPYRAKLLDTCEVSLVIGRATVYHKCTVYLLAKDNSHELMWISAFAKRNFQFAGIFNGIVHAKRTTYDKSDDRICVFYFVNFGCKLFA